MIEQRYQKAEQQLSVHPQTTGPAHRQSGYPDFITQGVFESQTLPPAEIRSPNGRYRVVQQVDEAAVADMALVQFSPLVQGVRPLNRRYKLALPGDEHLPLASLIIIDQQTRQQVCCDRPAMSASNGAFVETGRVFWDSNSRLYAIEHSRDRTALAFVQINPATGQSNVLYQEQGATHIHPSPLPFGSPVVKVLADTFIWYSQQSGWGQLYLHSLQTGERLHSITEGDCVVTRIHCVDEAKGQLYFTACGKEAGRNPYYEHLYRIHLDGSACVLLTPEDAQHDIQSIDLESQTFIDRFSRIDLPTKQVVRSLSDGAIIKTLIAVEVSQHSAEGFNHPIGFTAKAQDKETDLYGVMYRPDDFDPSKSYPVILAIYGTPHECIVPLRYAQTSTAVRDIYRSLAELGFIVVMMDPRGTPMRGKAFHDVAYGNLQNGGGIDDQVHVLKQLGKRHSWMDMGRVGITGHSGGGFASARAMMTHADFFKVCVSSAGNHDQSLYVAGWAETFQGLMEGDNYDPLAYDHLINNIKGKLLLVHGDADANVHIAHTLQLVDKLIDHNKDFDLLVLPNRGHLHAQDTYFIRRLWDYFVEHLLGENPPKEYAITPPVQPV